MSTIYSGTIYGGMPKQLTQQTESGLLVYYKLDEGSGTTATDSSGNGITGTMNSATWNASVPSTILFTDPYSGNFSSSGTTYMTSSFSGLNGIRQYTISMWLNLGSTSGIQIPIWFGNYSYLSYNSGYAWTVNNTGAISLSGSYPTGTWINIIITFDSSASPTTIVYKNGSSVGTGTQAVMSGATAFTLGGYPGNIRQYSGYIDDVRIYNRVLSSNEISNIVNGYPTGTLQKSIIYK